MASQCATLPPGRMRQHSGGYLPIENYGLIGNMRTCALVGMDGSVDYMCWYGRALLLSCHLRAELCQVVPPSTSVSVA